MNIGQAIKEARKKAGLTQTELAEKLEMTQTSFSQLENGVYNPSSQTVKAICEALQIPEPLLYILSIDENDVPEERKMMYEKLFPSVKKLALDIIAPDSKQ